MEDIFSQFTILSNQTLTNDPYSIEDLTKLFELESYKAWADTELEQQHQPRKADETLVETEGYIGLEMEMEMEMGEFYEFGEGEKLEGERDLGSFVGFGDSLWSLGKFMENGVSKYVEGAIRSAGDRVRSAWGRVHKVHYS